MVVRIADPQPILAINVHTVWAGKATRARVTVGPIVLRSVTQHRINGTIREDTPNGMALCICQINAACWSHREPLWTRKLR